MSPSMYRLNFWKQVYILHQIQPEYYNDFLGYTNNPIADEKLEENGQSTALSERRQIWCMTGILLVDA